MSSQGGAGRREVAWRIFAAEYDDASLEHSDSDEERAPNYVVTPTGARVNRLFVVGVLTEIEQVGDEVLRARIVDPTGGFVVYAGQYQPDALAFLERADPPMFVAVTGKARTFQPEDSDLVYTSIRPESINTVDAETRDRWTVQTAEQTVDRVQTFAQALDSGERGAALEQVLEANDVDTGLASGIPLALDYYHTTTPYLAAVRDVALDAARVVAGGQDEVGTLAANPDEPGEATIDYDGSLETAGVEPSAVESEPASPVESEVTSEIEAETDTESESEPAFETEPEGESETQAETEEAPAATETEASPDSGPEATTPPAAAREPERGGEPTQGGESDAIESETETEIESSDAGDELGDFDTDESGDQLGDFGASESDADSTDDLGDFDSDSSTAADESGDVDTEPAGEGVSGEMYEFEDGERERIEEEFGTEFSTGSEVDSAGEADIETPEPEPEVESESESEPEPEIETEPEPATESEPDAEPATDTGPESQPETEDSEKPVPENLENVVMESMRDLNEGDGVERERLMAAVMGTYDVTPADVEDALQDALMAGRCYESGEDTLKPI
ncbi:hypothetical protein [Haladaptatus sp. NG-SE-30]